MRFYLSTIAPDATTPAVSPKLPRHIDVKIGDERRRLPVSYFWKDAISAGTIRHPATGQRLTVTPERIDQWIETFKAMRGFGVEIPVPVDHSDRAEDNRGFVVAMRRQGDTLQLLHQMIGERGALLAVRNRCSALIDPSYTDEHGTEWGEAVVHSALTPKPVISGHGEFVPFAASRAVIRRMAFAQPPLDVMSPSEALAAVNESNERRDVERLTASTRCFAAQHGGRKADLADFAAARGDDRDPELAALAQETIDFLARQRVPHRKPAAPPKHGLVLVAGLGVVSSQHPLAPLGMTI